MSDNLIKWLNQEMHLSRQITNISEDFKTGYLFAELLYKTKLIQNLSEYKNTSNKKDIIHNFCLLDQILLKMGIILTEKNRDEIIKGNIYTSKIYLLKIKQFLDKKCINLEQLKQINSIVRIDFFEGVYNLDCKYYENTGLLEYCNENNILFIAYQPIRRNKITQKNYEFLVKLAKKYNKTQNQIMINWIVKEKGILPIIKSTNLDRIKENIDSISFDMEKADYKVLDDFQNEKINSIEVNWNDESGISIDQLANQNEDDI